MKKRFQIVLLLAGAFVALVIAGMMLAARQVGPQHRLGVLDGRLAPCPPTPNCVSSYSTDPEQAMPAIPYQTSQEVAHERLQAIIREMGGTLVTVEPDYIHALFRSQVFGFPDDVEFYFDSSAPVIHFRAAARMGQADMGVNRGRMRDITIAMTAPSAPEATPKYSFSYQSAFKLATMYGLSTRP
jgi:uncharacterized protein (DUF1499 family)